MLTHLLSFQPPLPCCVCCLQAKHPDEKFKILMTRCLIIPPCVFITVVFYYFYLEGGERVPLPDRAKTAGCLWSLDCPTWFQGPGSKLGILRNLVHVLNLNPSAHYPSCSLIRVWDSSWETLFQTSGNCWKKEIQKTEGAFFFSSFWDAYPELNFSSFHQFLWQFCVVAS